MIDIDLVPNLDVEVNSEEEIEANIIQSGPQGPKGDPGQDGKTPIKGIDYWNEADVQEIKNYCDNQVTNAIGGALNGTY